MVFFTPIKVKQPQLSSMKTEVVCMFCLIVMNKYVIVSNG